MINYLIILAIVLVLIALKLTRFVGIFLVIALLVILVAKNAGKVLAPFTGKKKGGSGQDGTA